MKHLDIQVKEICGKFTDQIKCFESKLAVDSNILGHINEFYKRRAQIEADYSENLFKLSSQISQKTRLEEQRRGEWKDYSPSIVLIRLLASTQHTARSHKNLSEIYAKQMTARIIDMQEDLSRLTKRSVDILQHQQSQMNEIFTSLVSQHKLYHRAIIEAQELQKKACKSVDLLDKEVGRCQDKRRELDKTNKIKKLRTDYIERANTAKDKFNDSTCHRNRYLLLLHAVRANIKQYYESDLKTIVDCANYGYHNNLARFCMNHASCEEALFNHHESIHKMFVTTSEEVNALEDRNVILNVYSPVLVQYENLDLSKDSHNSCLVRNGAKVEEDLDSLYESLSKEIKDLEIKMQDNESNINQLSATLQDLINQSDYDVVNYVMGLSGTSNSSSASLSSPHEKSQSLSRMGSSKKDNSNSSAKNTNSNSNTTTSGAGANANSNNTECFYTTTQKNLKDKRLSTEIKYLQSMQEYLHTRSKLLVSKTRRYFIETIPPPSSVQEEESSAVQPVGSSSSHSDNCSCGLNIRKQTAQLIGITSKLFSGDLKKYAEEQKELVPLVVRSCIELIRGHGMCNDGVFRIPGSQTDVQTYKVRFEEGLDPLVSMCGTPNNVNLVASLLKLYFRELNPPIFDRDTFNRIVDKFNEFKSSDEKTIKFLQNIVEKLHEAVYSTTKYLLAFLNHLVEYSASNLMDVTNIAIIFGPCLMPVPEDQANLLFQFQGVVNHVMYYLIKFYAEIFSGYPVSRRIASCMGATDYEYNRHGNNTTTTASASASTSLGGTASTTGAGSASNSSPLIPQRTTSLSSGDELEAVTEDCPSTSELDKLSLNDSINGSVDDELKKLRRNESSRTQRLDKDLSQSPETANRLRANSTGDATSAEITSRSSTASAPRGKDDWIDTNSDLREEIHQLTLYNSGSKTDVRLRYSGVVRGSESDAPDDDLQKAIGCLNDLEEQNFRKNRSTYIHIDKQSLTKSKFLSPFDILEPSLQSQKLCGSLEFSSSNDNDKNKANSTTNLTSASSIPKLTNADDTNLFPRSESVTTFKVKKPSSSKVSNIASAFEMNHAPTTVFTAPESLTPPRRGSNELSDGSFPSIGKINLTSSTNSLINNTLHQQQQQTNNNTNFPPPIRPKPKLLPKK